MSTPLDAEGLRRADAAYKGFPQFSEWLKCTVDAARWDHYTSQKDRNSYEPGILLKAQKVVERAAAFDTGAIEGLYKTDRGFTLTVATEAALWEAAMNEKGEQVRSLFESQLEAYDYVLDFATGKVPIAEAWIRTLHKKLCGSQKTFAVMTATGPQQQTLPLGEYKHHPNHVRRPDGVLHPYAPVDLTADEMHRLVTELRSDSFNEAHPVLQAAYAHYAFVIIHPFADGNGRVARALASVFTYRSSSIPLLILMDNRKDYISALEEADKGNYQLFVNFVLERGLDAVTLFDQSIQTALAPSIDDTLEAINSLYFTKGGYSHDEVDQASQRFLTAFQEEVSKQLGRVEVKGQLGTNVALSGGGVSLISPAYRMPRNTKTVLIITMNTAGPANAGVVREFKVQVPINCDHNDELIIATNDFEEKITARITELSPDVKPALQMRLSIVAERIVAGMLTELFLAARKSLHSD